jgi:hypothetical protein
MKAERDIFFLRLKPSLPLIMMLYVGAMLIAAPYFLKTYYAETLNTIGILVTTAGIVMYFAQHTEHRVAEMMEFLSRNTEHRIEKVLEVQGQLAEAGIGHVGVVTGHNMTPLLSQIEHGISLIVVNRDDSKLLVDLLRLLDGPMEGPRRVIVSDWTDASVSHDESAILAWARDLARGAKFRLLTRRATNTILVADRGAILISPISRGRGVYLFSAFSGSSKAAEFLLAEVEQSWSEATDYAEPQSAAAL